MAKTETCPKTHVFDDGDAFFDAILHDITHAQRHINIEVYKFQLHGIGIDFAKALIERAQQGIKVRLLIDGIGSLTWSGSWAKKMEQAGIQTKLYHPLPWQWWHLSRSVAQLPWLLKFFYLFTKLNTRNHRKIFNIDDKIIYLGSCNICSNHSKQKPYGKHWRDTALRIEGHDVQPILHAFEKSWGSLAWKQRCQHYFSTIDPKCPFHLNDTHLRRRYYFKLLLRKIRKSQKRIWISSAYFAPNSTLLRALIHAAIRRNIDVRIIIPRYSDIPLMTTASRFFYEKLIRANVQIFEYTPSMLHAKTLLIDQWAMVGTSNMNHRSLLHDLEIDYATSKRSIIDTLANHFLQDQGNSQHISAMTLKHMTLWQTMLGRIVITFKFMF